MVSLFDLDIAAFGPSGALWFQTLLLPAGFPGAAFSLRALVFGGGWAGCPSATSSCHFSQELQENTGIIVWNDWHGVPLKPLSWLCRFHTHARLVSQSVSLDARKGDGTHAKQPRTNQTENKYDEHGKRAKAAIGQVAALTSQSKRSYSLGALLVAQVCQSQLSLF